MEDRRESRCAAVAKEGAGDVAWMDGADCQCCRNPLRCIAHIDIDAAYAAMEMARLGVDPATPLAVQQWNGLVRLSSPRSLPLPLSLAEAPRRSQSTTPLAPLESRGTRLQLMRSASVLTC
mgnify:CR=1 FL=1